MGLLFLNLIKFRPKSTLISILINFFLYNSITFHDILQWRMGRSFVEDPHQNLCPYMNIYEKFGWSLTMTSLRTSDHIYIYIEKFILRKTSDHLIVGDVDKMYHGHFFHFWNKWTKPSVVISIFLITRFSFKLA